MKIVPLHSIFKKISSGNQPRGFLLVFALMAGLVLGHSQATLKKGGIYKPPKGKVAQHHNKMKKKKEGHIKTWNQYTKTKNKAFLSKKKKKK